MKLAASMRTFSIELNTKLFILFLMLYTVDTLYIVFVSRQTICHHQQKRQFRRWPYYWTAKIARNPRANKTKRTNNNERDMNERTTETDQFDWFIIECQTQREIVSRELDQNSIMRFKVVRPHNIYNSMESYAADKMFYFSFMHQKIRIHVYKTVWIRISSMRTVLLIAHLMVMFMF